MKLFYKSHLLLSILVNYKRTKANHKVKKEGAKYVQFFMIEMLLFFF